MEFILNKASKHQEPPFNYCDLMVLQKILNECTEKEFPEYCFQDDDDCDSFIKLDLFCPGDETSQPIVRIALFQGYINLFASEFKGFALGVNKIAGWLDETP